VPGNADLRRQCCCAHARSRRTAGFVDWRASYQRLDRWAMIVALASGRFLGRCMSAAVAPSRPPPAARQRPCSRSERSGGILGIWAVFARRRRAAQRNGPTGSLIIWRDQCSTAYYWGCCNHRRQSRARPTLGEQIGYLTDYSAPRWQATRSPRAALMLALLKRRAITAWQRRTVHGVGLSATRDWSVCTGH